MRSPIVFLFVFLSVTVDARVSFDKSEVLDNVDFQGTDKAAFRCSAGCRIYSPTKNERITVVDGAGNKITTLRILSEMNLATETFDLPPGSYQLKNVGSADPWFVFYAVEMDAAHFDTKVFYLQSDKMFYAPGNQNYTFLSATGVVSFDSFMEFKTADALPIIYAAGFDSIDVCRPVFTARSAPALESTEFAVNSPIATVMFERHAGGRMMLTGAPIKWNQLSSQDMSAVYTSPGYVGCPSVGDSLYTFASAETSVHVESTIASADGLKLSISGDYEIADPEDALEIIINNDVMKLSGNSTISKSYEGNLFDVKLAWEKNKHAKDGFAVQIDVETSGQ